MHIYIAKNSVGAVSQKNIKVTGGMTVISIYHFYSVISVHGRQIKEKVFSRKVNVIKLFN